MKKFFKNNKKKKVVRPELTTLYHYTLYFKTVDGEHHEFHNICAGDPSTINCSLPDFYMIGQDHLKDDNGVRYPINNVLSYYFKEDLQINDVIKKHNGWIGGEKFWITWYQDNEIEQWIEEE